MKLEEAFVLLPCHSLEDFPTHCEGNQAEALLAAVSALWHPALLAATNKLPTWHRADGPPDALAGRLIVIPPSSEPLLLAGWVARATGEGAHVVRKLHRRSEIVEASLAALDPLPPLDAELVADFLALAMAWLSVELLTRQMRYMSHIDEPHLTSETVAAATACMAGDVETARQHLRACFEVVVEARERFYPVDAYLIDLTLVAPTTVGDALRQQLAEDWLQNLLISGETLESLAASAPDTLAALRAALDRQGVALAGGEYREGELPLCPLERILDEFRAGRAAYERIVGQPPRVYGRRRFGLSPILPQVLSRFGYMGAIHFTLDDGRFATAPQSKTRWEGVDYSAVDALARLPLDAAKPESFLGLPRTLGESMDRDHVATVVFAHWPGQTSYFYDDLRRMNAYGAPLGKFITLVDYFTHTASPGELTKFKADGYRSPYLRQAVANGHHAPLSAVQDRYTGDALAESIAALDTMADALGAAPPRSAVRSDDAESRAGGAHVDPSLDDLAARQAAAGARLVETMSARAATSAPASAGALCVVNPLSFARRMAVDAGAMSGLPAVEGNVVAAQESGTARTVVVDVPGMGAAWLVPGGASPRGRKAPKPIAAETVLSNGLLRVEIHPTTGGIHSIHDLALRGNRLSSQLAIRTPGPRRRPGDIRRDPDEGAEYSVMAADAVEIGENGPALGEIISRGRLLDRQGQRLASFVQRFRLAREMRVLSIEVDLHIDDAQRPGGDPWESYCAARFAWAEEDADLYRSVGMALQPTEARQIEAPYFIEARSSRRARRS